MFDQMTARHDSALTMARAMMMTGVDMGFTLAHWRDHTRKMIEEFGLPQPKDLIAWVSGGQGCDADVEDWNQKFDMR